MPQLGDALAIRANGLQVEKMYANGVQVWPFVAPTPGNISISTQPLTPPVFPIVRSFDGRGLVDSASQVFYGVADTAWNAISRMSRAEFTSYLEQRRAQGYTAVLLSILDINSRSRVQVASGLTPFLGSNNNAQLIQPQVTGDYDYWDHVEWCVDECAAKGMLAVLVPAWYGGWGDAWRGHIATTASQTSIATTYGDFLASRLGNRPNIFWLLGGDNAPTTAGNNVSGVPSGLPRVDVTAATNALATALKAGATVEQMMTYHTFRGDVAYTYFGTQPWYTMHAAYAFADTASKVATEWQRTNVKPVFMVEAYYANRNEMASPPHLNRREIRAEAWQSMLTGAFITANGMEPVWRVDDPYAGWQVAMGYPESADMTVLSRVLQTFRGKTLHADLSVPVISPRGTGTSVNPGVISSDGRLGLVYVPAAGTYSVNLAPFVGDPDLAWVHPETAEVVQIVSSAPGAGVAVQTPTGWADAVLVVSTT